MPATSGEAASADGAGDSGAVRRGPKESYPFRPVLGLSVLAVLGLLATAGVRSYRDLESARGHEQAKLDEIAGVRERVTELDRRIDRIRNDPLMLERLAREDLGLVRASDIVLILREDLPALAGKPPSAWAPVGSATG